MYTSRSQTNARTPLRQESGIRTGIGKQHITKKRFATRDQPTWQNCKFPRPPPMRNDTTLQQSSVETSTATILTREPSDITWRTSSPMRSITPKSVPVSSRSTPSRQLEIRSASLGNSNSISCIQLDDLLTNDESVLSERDKEIGRDVLKRKAGEFTPLVLPSYITRGESESPSSKSNSNYGQSLKRFRISSAESTNRSQDVSIGLRYISRMLELSAQGPKEKQPTQKQRSSSALSSLTKITSDNLIRIRRRSEPIMTSSRAYNVQESVSSTPAPGEGHLEQTRRSSVSAPATRGAGSVSLSSSRDAKPRHSVRKLPKLSTKEPYADREWRPPVLQKFSMKQPWAPKQQTTRYFPKYSNLQDVNCRNPYLVPGSILYKSSI